MSKHETILANLLAITRCRSESKAMTDWQEVDRIDLPAHVEQATCELCGTRFRRGAVVRRVVSRRLKPVVLTVGGDCLQSLHEHQFRDAKELAACRASTRRELSSRYAGLVDVGSWIAWVYEHAPSRLRDVAGELNCVNAARSKIKLKKLIEFHDDVRKYPAEALLPQAEPLRSCGIDVPTVLTLNKARSLVDAEDAELEGALACLGERYLNEWQSQSIDGWSTAWRSLNSSQRRAVTVLAAISEDGVVDWNDWLDRYFRFRPLSLPFNVPMFVWNAAYGVCLALDEVSSTHALTTVFVWSRNEYARFRVDSLAAITPKRRKLAPLEREVFLDIPCWIAAEAPAG